MVAGTPAKDLCSAALEVFGGGGGVPKPAAWWTFYQWGVYANSDRRDGAALGLAERPEASLSLGLGATGSLIFPIPSRVTAPNQMVSATSATGADASRAAVANLSAVVLSARAAACAIGPATRMILPNYRNGPEEATYQPQGGQRTLRARHAVCIRINSNNQAKVNRGQKTRHFTTGSKDTLEKSVPEAYRERYGHTVAALS